MGPCRPHEHCYQDRHPLLSDELYDYENFLLVPTLLNHFKHSFKPFTKEWFQSFLPWLLTPNHCATFISVIYCHSEVHKVCVLCICVLARTFKYRLQWFPTIGIPSLACEGLAYNRQFCGCNRCCILVITVLYAISCYILVCTIHTENHLRQMI